MDTCRRLEMIGDWNLLGSVPYLDPDKVVKRCLPIGLGRHRAWAGWELRGARRFSAA